MKILNPFLWKKKPISIASDSASRTAQRICSATRVILAKWIFSGLRCPHLYKWDTKVNESDNVQLCDTPKSYLH